VGGCGLPTLRGYRDGRDELATTIRHSPVADNYTDELVALQAAIDEAREVAQRWRTSGAHAQVRLLEAHRDVIADHAAPCVELGSNRTRRPSTAMPKLAKKSNTASTHESLSTRSIRQRTCSSP
jgi:acyl-CoA reductase-like NAD-dependent aldehyde dehydrogenase